MSLCELHEALNRLKESMDRLHDALQESLWVSIVVWMAFVVFVIWAYNGT